MIPMPRMETGERLVPIRVSITQQITPLSSATLQIRNDQELPQRAYVELFTPVGSAGWFRARVPEDNYTSRVTTVMMDHAICEVGDWLARTKLEQTRESLSSAMTRVWAYYGGSRWQLGTVNVSANVVYSLDYGNLLTTIISLLSQVPSAMMSFDFSTTPWTLNIVRRGTTVAAEGRLGRNVTSARVTKDDSKMCTRVWLEGLSSNASIGHMDADTIGTYGVIEKRLQNNDYTSAQANTIASQYLEKHKHPKYSITINGIELSQITGEPMDKAEIGALYRLAIPKENVVIEQNVVTLHWPDVYGNPKAVTITLAEEEYSQTQFLRVQQTATETAYTPRQARSGNSSTVFSQTDSMFGFYAAAAGDSGDGAQETIQNGLIEILVRSGGQSGKIQISEGENGIQVEITGNPITLSNGQRKIELNGENIGFNIDGTLYSAGTQELTIGGTQYRLITLS